MTSTIRFASRAPVCGESLAMTGKAFGHHRIQTTTSYTHTARDTVKIVARMADSSAADMDRHPGGSSSADRLTA